MNTLYSVSSLLQVIVNDFMDKTADNENYWANVRFSKKSKESHDLHDVADQYYNDDPIACAARLTRFCERFLTYQLIKSNRKLYHDFLNNSEENITNDLVAPSSFILHSLADCLKCVIFLYVGNDPETNALTTHSFHSIKFFESGFKKTVLIEICYDIHGCLYFIPKNVGEHRALYCNNLQKSSTESDETLSKSYKISGNRDPRLNKDRLNENSSYRDLLDKKSTDTINNSLTNDTESKKILHMPKDFSLCPNDREDQVDCLENQIQQNNEFAMDFMCDPVNNEFEDAAAAHLDDLLCEDGELGDIASDFNNIITNQPQLQSVPTCGSICSNEASSFDNDFYCKSTILNKHIKNFLQNLMKSLRQTIADSNKEMKEIRQNKKKFLAKKALNKVKKPRGRPKVKK